MPGENEQQSAPANPAEPIVKEVHFVERRKTIHQEVYEDPIDNRKKETERVEVVKNRGGEEPSSNGSNRMLVIALVLVGLVAVMAVLTAGYTYQKLQSLQAGYEPQGQQEEIVQQREPPQAEPQLPPPPAQLERPRSVGVDLNSAPRPEIKFQQWNHNAPPGYRWERGVPGDRGCRDLIGNDGRTFTRCPNKLVRD